MSVNSDILAGIIYGRVEPHIYAFTTQTVPNYLKVGDTYRPVQVRLDEWRKRYYNLKKEFEHTAKVSDDTYFRDFAVHSFLESKDFHRMEKHELDEGVYYSNEFFRNASDKDVQEAIDDIRASFANKDNRYAFYSTEDRLPLGEVEYERNADWTPRENQQEVIDNFVKAVANGRTNLLMYAVMRFGKSFTSLCCAKAMDAKLVVVVCGKTAVKEEWKSNVQRPKILEGYEFVTTDTLRTNPNAISLLLSEGKRVVVFLTLQDLLGEDVKERHLDLFAHNQQGNLDLLIIDESHFAARSEETGKVLNGMKAQSVKKELDGYDQDFAELDEPIKFFTPKVKLHLSGTPYRILMEGEFQKEDIIAFVQYNDIIDEQQKWDEENIDKDEWENPYYGFPQMVRFAFNLNQSSISRLQEMREDGIDYRLNTLLEVNNKKFKYENEVIDLLKAIDGSKEDENIFSFLNYERIKEGKMCRHIVMVLPYRASCDAMKKMLSTNTFSNLGEYEVLNLAGLDCPTKYKDSDYASQVKMDIEGFEARGKKTITLTVGKMLTGSTVSQWDTMIFLKDASSPQEYDQAIFRLQSQYVKTIKSDDGKLIRYNMKPQTLLVDFDPTRMFVMQNRKSLISNINTSIRGNEELEDRLQRDLEISPIIWLNRDKLQRVEPANIIDAVRLYSANKSIMDETFDVIVDDSVFDDVALKRLIDKEQEMSASGNIFTAKPNDGDGEDIETGETNKTPTPTGESTPTEVRKQTFEDNELKSLRKKLQTYYFKLMLFAYLSDGEEKTLHDIINCIETCEDGKRIAKNLQLNVEVIKMIREKIHPMALNELENKINNIDTLGEDAGANVQAAMRRFSRLSSSEITTPDWVAKKMVDTLPNDVTAESRFLNIAGKIGEFEYALCNKYGDHVKKNIYTIPTSGVTYECTRKVCHMLGIPEENVFRDFTSYDLIDNTKKEQIMEMLQSIGFDAVIGNPPYQEDKKDTSDKPIYNDIMDFAYDISLHSCLITPGRFLFNAGKTPKEWNEKMLSDEHLKVSYYSNNCKDVLPDVGFKGGVAVTLRSTNKVYGEIGFYSEQQEVNSIFRKVWSTDKKCSSLADIVHLQNKFNLSELYKDYPEYRDIIGSGGKEKRLTTNIFTQLDIFSQETMSSNDVCVLGLIDNKRITRYISAKYLENHANTFSYKVVLPKSNGTGAFGEALSTPIVSAPQMGYTQSFIGFGSFTNQKEAEAALKYLKTKFARTLLGVLKVTQDNNKEVWKYVPLQDFTSNSDINWDVSVAEIDKQLFVKYNLTTEEIAFVESEVVPMA